MWPGHSILRNKLKSYRHLYKLFKKTDFLRYTLTTSKSLGWGSRLPDGNWTGLLGMLQKDVLQQKYIFNKTRQQISDKTLLHIMPIGEFIYFTH